MEERVYEKVGELFICTPITVTDPCYDSDVWCRLDNVEIPHGHYACMIARSNGRVSNIALVLDEYTEERLTMDEIGYVGVDAGLCGFFVNKPDFTDDAWRDLCDKMLNGSDDIKTPDKSAYRYSGTWTGFWSSSGYGDGGYPVYILYSGEIPVGIEIEFIPGDWDNGL